jgi:MFS family permease
MAGEKKHLPILGATGASTTSASSTTGASSTSTTSAKEEAPKRRLPMLPKVEVADESDEERPPWHWSAIGAVAVFIAWLPLAYIVNGPLGRLFDGGAAAPIAAVALNVAAFAAAAFGGGYLVGRFGGRAGVKEATVCGVAAAVIAWALAVVQARSGVLVWIMLLTGVAMIGAGSARFGGRAGLRGRKP